MVGHPIHQCPLHHLANATALDVLDVLGDRDLIFASFIGNVSGQMLICVASFVLDTVVNPNIVYYL